MVLENNIINVTERPEPLNGNKRRLIVISCVSLSDNSWKDTMGDDNKNAFKFFPLSNKS